VLYSIRGMDSVSFRFSGQDVGESTPTHYDMLKPEHRPKIPSKYTFPPMTREFKPYVLVRLRRRLRSDPCEHSPKELDGWTSFVHPEGALYFYHAATVSAHDQHAESDSRLPAYIHLHKPVQR
jgi:hypothetical protein